MKKKIITDEKGNVKIQRIYSQAELAVIRQKACALQCRQEVEMLRKRRKENQVKEVKEHRKEYLSRPEVKEHRKEYQKEYHSRPEVKEHRKEYQKEYLSRPEVKEHRKEYQKEHLSRPEAKEHRKEYNRKRYLKRKTCVSATIPSTSTWQGTILNVSKR